MSTLASSRKNAFWNGRAVGVSETHRELGQTLQSVENEMSLTSEGMQRIESLRHLQRVVQEALLPNWDGYGANAVSPFTYGWAFQFLMVIPSFIPTPDVAMNPNGDISFEWYRDAQHVFAVSIDERGLLYYSGLFGPKSTYGTDQFAGELPDEILRQVQRHLSASD